ncbi:hypothetical protein BGW39_002884 [Mortierella sp. 14UC]|nr:hypothetical protein BGW39_002884 [Mortierella sp. 14UC]
MQELQFSNYPRPNFVTTAYGGEAEPFVNAPEPESKDQECLKRNSSQLHSILQYVRLSPLPEPPRLQILLILPLLPLQ